MWKKLKCALSHRRKMYMTTPMKKKVLFLCFDCVDEQAGWTMMPKPERPPELRN